MKILRQALVVPVFKKLYGQPIGTKVKHCWNWAITEYPDIVAAAPFGVVGLGIFAFIVMKYMGDPRPPKYFNEITIYRPNDPRVEHIRQDETLRPTSVPLFTNINTI